MRRIKLVLVIAAAMVVLLVMFPNPAIAHEGGMCPMMGGYDYGYDTGDHSH